MHNTPSPLFFNTNQSVVRKKIIKDLAYKIHSIPSTLSHPGVTKLMVYCRGVETRV